MRRRTYEVPGPAVADAMPLDARARQIFQYFKGYNYEVKSTGDVITFVGNYKASGSEWRVAGVVVVVCVRVSVYVVGGGGISSLRRGMG